MAHRTGNGSGRSGAALRHPPGAAAAAPGGFAFFAGSLLPAKKASSGGETFPRRKQEKIFQFHFPNPVFMITVFVISHIYYIVIQQN